MHRSLPVILAAVLLLAGGAVPSFAHTSDEIELTCPVDKTRFKTTVTMSMTEFGSYLDFQKTGAIGSYYEDLVHGCPKCHFSGTGDDFKKKPSDAVVTKILAELKPMRTSKWPDHVTECVFTAKIYEWEGRSNSDIADQYRVASYLLREAPEGEQERRREMQRTAASYYEKALAKAEVSGNTRAILAYLIAELDRRSGAFSAALDWYGKAIAEPDRPDWLDDVVAKQRKMAEAQEADNSL
jgi:hypothetical protein